MALIEIDTHPSRAQLRVFALLWLVFLGGVGAVVLWRAGSWPAAAALWGLAVALPAVGWAWDAWLRVVYVGMAYAAAPIALVVSFVLLAGVYYLVMTPIGLGMRLFGRDPMARRFDPAARTYWIPRRHSEDVRRYFRQF